MKKLSYFIVLILGLALTGCSLLSNISQVPTIEQSGITCLTKALPLSDDLVGLWHFSDNLIDSSGNNNNGVVNGTEDYADSVSPMGRAFSFDGSTCVCVADSDSLDITRATLEAWIKPSVPKQTSYARIVFKGTNSPFVPLYFLAYDGSGTHMRMVVYINGAAKSATSTITLTDTTKWYHIVGTYDGTDVKIYVDDALEGTTSVLGDEDIDTGLEALGIGRNPEVNKYGYKGLIDEVRIWKVALSTDQFGFIYEWTDFLPPVDSVVLNIVKAGRAIPVKFSLNGDQGLDIFEKGYPKPIVFECNEQPDSAVEIDETVTAGESSLSYDATADQYIYVWKTDKLWAGLCCQLLVRLNDGTSHEASFKFK